MKEKTKERILKIVHIISYVMSALFIILCISLGLGYCNARKSAAIGKPAERQTQQKVNDTYMSEYQTNLYATLFSKNGYNALYNVQFSFDLDYFKANTFNNDFLSPYGVKKMRFEYDSSNTNILFFYTSTRDTYTYIYGRGGIELDYSNGNTLDVRGYNQGYTGIVRLAHYDFDYPEYNSSSFNELIFKYNENASTNYSIKFYAYDRYDNQIFSKTTMFDNSTTISGTSSNYSFNIENLYSNMFPIQYQNFDFVGDLNLNSFIGGSSSGYFVYSGTALDFNSNKGVILNSPRVFMCNGKVYNRMRLIATDLDTNTYVAMDNSSGGYDVKKYNGQPNAFYCMYLTYDNTLTNEAVMVNQIDFVYREGGGAVHLNHYSWVNDNYKHITILDKDYKKAQDFYEQPGADTLSILQSGLNRSIGYTNTTFDIGSTNVFVLFTTAFSSLGTILSIQILPGITLGLLLFLPLVVGIIIAIIWIVKR